MRSIGRNTGHGTAVENLGGGWLETGVIEAGWGGRSREQRRKALREYTEAPVRQGRLESPWAGLIGGVGGLKYGAAAQAVQRFATGLPKGAAKVRFVEGMKRRLRERTMRGGWRVDH